VAGNTGQIILVLEHGVSFYLNSTVQEFLYSGIFYKAGSYSCLRPWRPWGTIKRHMDAGLGSIRTLFIEDGYAQTGTYVKFVSVQIKGIFQGC
jgi:hypothetical protein